MDKLLRIKNTFIFGIIIQSNGILFPNEFYNCRLIVKKMQTNSVNKIENIYINEEKDVCVYYEENQQQSVINRHRFSIWFDYTIK